MQKDNKQRTNIGSRLRMARELAGLSQAQVAKMLSLHRPSISEIEAGRRKVSAEELTKLADIYDVDISFLTGTESRKESEVAKLAAREFEKLKPADCERMMYLLRTLRSNRRKGK